MRRHSIIKLIILSAALIAVTCGCSEEKAVFPKHGVYKYNNKSLTITKEIKTIDLRLDSGNIQIFCWDKDEIKYEAKHTVRGNENDEELEKLLEKYSITAQKLDSKMVLTIAYDGKIKKPQDLYTDFKLTIPRRIKSLVLNQQVGTLRVEDRYEGQFDLTMDSVNCEIGDLKGLLKVNGQSGNVRLNSGKITDGSNIQVKIGNIYVKAECEGESKYSFSTEVGNIELHFPVSSTISLKSYGTVENNQFAGIDGNIQVDASTNMGKISVNGY